MCEEKFYGYDYKTKEYKEPPTRLFIMPNGDTYIDCDTEDSGWDLKIDSWNVKTEEWRGYFKTKQEFYEHNKPRLYYHEFEHFNYCPYCGRKF